MRILCTEPQFCHWGPSAPKKIDKPGYARYNTFFHAPKNNEGESNLTLITWFPHWSPLYCWMRLIKRFFLVTGLVILKLTHSLIPAENPNSSNFYGTEGVAVMLLFSQLWIQCTKSGITHKNQKRITAGTHTTPLYLKTWHITEVLCFPMPSYMWNHILLGNWGTCLSF